MIVADGTPAYVDVLVTDNRSYRGPSAHPGYSAQDVEGEGSSVSVFTNFSLFDGELLYALARAATPTAATRRKPSSSTANGSGAAGRPIGDRVRKPRQSGAVQFLVLQRIRNFARSRFHRSADFGDTTAHQRHTKARFGSK